MYDMPPINFEPMQCQDCQQIFCSQCIKTWLQLSNHCPMICKSIPPILQMPSDIDLNDSTKHRLRSENQDNGCNIVSSRNGIQSHQNYPNNQNDQHNESQCFCSSNNPEKEFAFIGQKIQNLEEYYKNIVQTNLLMVNQLDSQNQSIIDIMNNNFNQGQLLFCLLQEIQTIQYITWNQNQLILQANKNYVSLNEKTKILEQEIQSLRQQDNESINIKYSKSPEASVLELSEYNIKKKLIKRNIIKHKTKYDKLIEQKVHEEIKKLLRKKMSNRDRDYSFDVEVEKKYYHECLSNKFCFFYQMRSTIHLLYRLGRTGSIKQLQNFCSSSEQNKVSILVHQIQRESINNSFKKCEKLQNLLDELKPLQPLMKWTDIIYMSHITTIPKEINTLLLSQAANLIQNENEGIQNEAVVKSLDQLLMPGIDVDLEVIEKFKLMFKNPNFQDFSTKAAAHLISFFGKLQVFNHFRSIEINKELSKIFKEKVSYMNGEELGICAIGMGFCGFDDKTDWDTLDSLTVSKINEINYYDLMRISTGFGFLNLGSEQFWKLFVEHMQKNLQDLTPDVLTQSLLTLSQCQRGQPLVYQQIEQQFLNDYEHYDLANKLTIFASFARVQDGSYNLWHQFAQDAELLLNNQNPEDLGQLTLEFLKVSSLLPSSVMNLIIKMNLEAASQMTETTSKAVMDALQRSNFINK